MSGGLGTGGEGMIMQQPRVAARRDRAADDSCVVMTHTPLVLQSRATSTDSLPGRRRASPSQASRGSQRAGQDRKASVASS